MTRWDDPQPPFDPVEFKRPMLAQLRVQRRPSPMPVPAWYYRTLQKLHRRREWYRALGLSK